MKASDFIKEQIKNSNITDPIKIREHILNECGIAVSISEIKKHINEIIEE